MAMFYKNICRFAQCNLEFANVYDLIQHIEETHIPNDAEKKPETQPQVACAPLSAICRYFQKLPDQSARPIIPEPTFQQPSPNIPPGAQAAAAMAAAAAAASVKKRLPAIIAQPSAATANSTGVNALMGSGQGHSQMSITPTTSILFHPPANVVPARSTVPTPASHISEGDDESVSAGRESRSSESSTLVEDNSNDPNLFYKIISPGGGEDRRFVCTVPGCKKSYKNMNGIRYHTKIQHTQAGIIEAQQNAKKFRCQCGKAYKTSHGLHNHMLQTHHRQAPVPSSAHSPNSGMTNVGATAAGGVRYSSGMAGVSATASQVKRGLPVSLMAGGGGGSTGTVGQKQPIQGPISTMNTTYYSQQPNSKPNIGAGGTSSTATLPSGVSVQVSNLGSGAPTTVQVGQQGALGIAPSTIGGPAPLGSTTHTQGLHISAGPGRRLSSNMQQMHSMGGRPLKIHSAASSGAGSMAQGFVTTSSNVNAFSKAQSTVTTMGGSGGNDHMDI